jgi:hypothetical protein
MRPRVRLDRLIVVAWHRPAPKLPRPRDYQIVWDRRVSRQGKTANYERVRELRHRNTGTRVWWQYQPLHGWLKKWRITWVAPKGGEIKPADVFAILRHCRYMRSTLVELAFDFGGDKGIDHAFVRAHAKFGKSRFRMDRGGPGQRRYGSRRSGKLVRCYWKEEVEAYRVEIEMHSSLINHPQSVSCHFPEDLMQQIGCVAFHIMPKHLQFVRFDWEALKSYLRHRFGQQGNELFEEARRRAHVSLQRTGRYLRRKGVNNVHRFLVPMRINDAVHDALLDWGNEFQDGF